MSKTKNYVEISLNEQRSAVIDYQDLALIEGLSWKCDISNGRPRAVTYVQGAKLYMHSLILGATDGRRVYHLNGDRLDNRRDNLSFKKPYQPKRAPKNRYRGVTRKKGTRRWEAYTRVDGVYCHIGSFGTAIEAALAYDLAERYFNGSKATVNITDTTNFRTDALQTLIERVSIRIRSFQTGMAAPHIDSTSNYRGVSYLKRANAWKASIQVNHKVHDLGTYKTPSEAARAYNQAASTLLGRLAKLNFPYLGPSGKAPKASEMNHDQTGIGDGFGNQEVYAENQCFHERRLCRRYVRHGQHKQVPQKKNATVGFAGLRV